MIKLMIVYAVFWLLALVIYLKIDKIYTLHNLAVNQREWNEFSKGMTKDEKLEVFNEWLLNNKIKHRWKFLYIPKM